MSAIDQLRAKIERLLRQYAASQANVKRLERQVKDSERTIESLQAQLAKTEEQLLSLEIGRAIPDADSRAHSRKKLDKVIQEIDKILTSLND